MKYVRTVRGQNVILLNVQQTVCLLGCKRLEVNTRITLLFTCSLLINETLIPGSLVFNIHK
jgi:hypothetical protein